MVNSTTFDAGRTAFRILSDNPVLKNKIASAIGCPTDQVAEGIREALRFLQLVAEQDIGKLTPSHRVDLVWHELILCTRVYAELCDSHFGRFIHHHPGGSDVNIRRQFNSTLDAYRAKFGPPDPFFWGIRQSDKHSISIDRDPSECGICEAD